MQSNLEMGLGAICMALIAMLLVLLFRLRRLRAQKAGAERAQAETQANLTAILDNAPAEIYLKDAEGRYVLINRQFERLFDVRNHDVKGLFPSDVHEPALAERRRAQDLQVLRSGQAYTREEQVETIDGPSVLHTIKFPIKSEEGRVLGLGAVVTDITELAQAREQAIRLEAQLTDAIDTLPAGFVYFDPSGRVALINKTYQDMLAQIGFPAETDATFEELLRAVLAQGRIPEAEGREEDWIKERMQIPSRVGHELEYQMPDGRWYKAFDRRTSDGGIVGVRVDISMLKRQQQSLSAVIAERDAAEQRFRDIAGISNSWFWEQDRDLRFTYISEVYERLTGFDGVSRIGKTRTEVIGEDQVILTSSDWNWLAETLEKRQTFENFVYGIRGEQDSLLWVQISGAPYFDADGAFAGYRGVGSDVTALYTAMTSAEAANRAKSDFLANISHEIRTPLSAVLGMAEELERRVEGSEERRFARTIRESGEHLLEVINDVLDFSKIEARRLELNQVPFQPADLINRIVALHSMKAAEKGLDFSADLEAGMPPVRLGDPQRILQILHNLVGNAVKFTLSGAVTVRLERAKPEGLAISIKDTGIGMTDEQMSRIFDGFAQADTSISRRFGGTGLGMSITQKLIDAMGGTMEVESAPDEGTSVRVVLPLPVSDLPVEAAAPPSSDTVETLPQGVRVLAVDDNETNRTLIGLLLERIGAEAVIVENGPAALAALEEQRFDLVLMDIAMPGMDGIEVLSHLRAQERRSNLKRLPVIAVTANALSHQIDAYLALGFEGHVAKPIQMTEIFTAIRDVLPSEGKVSAAE